MKRFSEQLHKKSQSVKLRAAEKRELRERVVSYMEYHPLPAEMKKKKVFKEPALLIETYKEVAIPFKMLARATAAFAVLVIIAVPVMAERSVPGDGLYAVKKFNEEVRSTLAFDTVQKVEWETERLNRRIAEARLLASEGRLTDEVEAEVAAAVRTHSENAQKNIEVLRTQDADEATLASIAFETTLAVQSAALEQDDKEVADEQSGEGVTSDTPSILAVAVEETHAKATAGNASSTIPAFDKVMAKVELNTTRAYELLNTLKVTATDEQIAEVTRRLEDIERSIAEALELREENDDVAREVLVDALQRTQKLIVFMTDIEVSQSVDIEEIVPVVLTGEEKIAELTQLQTELNEKVVVIEESLVINEDEAIAEKASAALLEISTLMEDFEVSSEAYEAMLPKVIEATEFADDVLQLFAVQETEEVVITPEVETGSSTDDVASSTEEVTEEPIEEAEGEVAEEEIVVEEVVVDPVEPQATEESTEVVDTE